MNIRIHMNVHMNVYIDLNIDTNIMYKCTYTLNMYRCKHQRCFFRRHISCDWSQPQPHVFVDHRSLKCEQKPHQELPRGKVLKEFPLTMVGISREEDLGICSCFCFFVFFFFRILEQGQGKFGVFFERKLVVGSGDGWIGGV